MKVTEANKVDKPRERSRHDSAKELKAKKKFVRRIAKEIGRIILARRMEQP